MLKINFQYNYDDNNNDCEAKVNKNDAFNNYYYNRRILCFISYINMNILEDVCERHLEKDRKIIMNDKKSIIFVNI